MLGVADKDPYIELDVDPDVELDLDPAVELDINPDVELDVDTGVELDVLAPDVNPPNIEPEERDPLTGIEK